MPVVPGQQHPHTAHAGAGGPGAGGQQVMFSPTFQAQPAPGMAGGGPQLPPGAGHQPTGAMQQQAQAGPLGRVPFAPPKRESKALAIFVRVD